MKRHQARAHVTSAEGIRSRTGSSTRCASLRPLSVCALPEQRERYREQYKEHHASRRVLGASAANIVTGRLDMGHSHPPHLRCRPVVTQPAGYFVVEGLKRAQSLHWLTDAPWVMRWCAVARRAYHLDLYHVLWL